MHNLGAAVSKTGSILITGLSSPDFGYRIWTSRPFELDKKTSMRKAIDQETLSALVENGAVREIQATRGPGGVGFSLSARLGGRWLPVRSKREPLRIWASLTAVERFCVKAGIKRFEVEL